MNEKYNLFGIKREGPPSTEALIEDWEVASKGLTKEREEKRRHIARFGTGGLSAALALTLLAAIPWALQQRDGEAAAARSMATNESVDSDARTTIYYPKGDELEAHKKIVLLSEEEAEMPPVQMEWGKSPYQPGTAVIEKEPATPTEEASLFNYGTQTERPSWKLDRHEWQQEEPAEKVAPEVRYADFEYQPKTVSVTVKPFQGAMSMLLDWTHEAKERGASYDENTPAGTLLKALEANTLMHAVEDVTRTAGLWDPEKKTSYRVLPGATLEVADDGNLVLSNANGEKIVIGGDEPYAGTHMIRTA